MAWLMLLSLLITSDITQAQEKPANDDFANAITLTGTSGQTTGSNVGATKEDGEPEHSYYSRDKSVWWKWTAPKNGYFTFDAQGTDFDSCIAVYTGSGVNSLTSINYSNGYSGATFNAQSGVQYYIVVAEYYYYYYATEGDIILNWRTATPPANDKFSNAGLIQGDSGQAKGTILDATKEQDEPEHAGQDYGKSVWWKWTAPKTDYFTFDTKESGCWPSIAVYTGSGVNTLTAVISSYNGWYGVTFKAESGVLYYIAVDGYSWEYDNSMDVNLNWRTAVRPVNDDFVNSITLTGISGQAGGSNVDATRESDESWRGTKSVWWKWIPPETVNYAFVNTRGSNFYTELTVYTGSTLYSLYERAYSYSDIGSDDYYSSAVVFQVEPCADYYIAVNGESGSNGNIVLNYGGLSPTTLAGDFSGNGKLGLEDGVGILQTLTGVRTGYETGSAVVSMVPASGAVNVSVNTVIRVTFSNDMDASTVNQYTFYVRTGSGYGAVSISGTVTYTNKTATFTPASSLAYDTVYTVIISNSVRDVNGNKPIRCDKTWSFITEAE